MNTFNNLDSNKKCPKGKSPRSVPQFGITATITDPELLFLESWFVEVESWFGEVESWFVEVESWFVEVESWFLEGATSRATSTYFTRLFRL